MAISFVCSDCGRRLKADEKFAGRTVNCPVCKSLVHIPLPDVDPDATAYSLLTRPSEDVRPPLPKLGFSAESKPDEPDDEAPVRKRPQVRRSEVSPDPTTRNKSLPPLTANETPLWLRHLHWLLALALIPLAFSLLHKSADDEDLKSRLRDTVAQAPPEVQDRVEQVMSSDDATVDDLFNVLPNRKLLGAFLPRNSKLHWLMALGSIVLFMSFFMLLGSDGSTAPWHLLLVGLFTATIGIALLLLLQLAAEATQGSWYFGRGIVALVLLIVKLIGASYSAASDPDSNFFLSFLGYTVGVGLCEETCKLLPVMFRFRRPNDYSWRNAFLWGLASGAGFGISEGIIYAGTGYNGITGGQIYLVRFISCVALHAVWTGSAAVMLHRKQHLLQASMPWYEYFVPLIVYVGIPMVLHGLYDTCLKKDQNAIALVVAIVSFGYLAVQIYLLHGADDLEANRQMLREYQRRRKAMA